VCLRHVRNGVSTGGCHVGPSHTARCGLSVGSVPPSKSHSIEENRDEVGDQGSLGLRGLMQLSREAMWDTSGEMLGVASAPSSCGILGACSGWRVMFIRALILAFLGARLIGDVHELGVGCSWLLGGGGVGG
jgi:hypothetical protein